MGDWRILFLMFVGFVVVLELEAIRRTLHERLYSIEDLLELASNIGPEDRDGLRHLHELTRHPSE